MLNRLKVTFASLIVAISAFGNVNDLPVTIVNGVKYYTYTVVQGEGEIAVSKKLKISIKQIERYNPSVKSGLKLGQKLLFPVEDFGIKAKTTDIKGKHKRRSIVEYTADKGESLYGISKKFGMTQEEFLALNPEADGGIKSESTYKVYSDTQPAAEPSIAKGQRHHTISHGETLFSLAKTFGCSVDDIVALNPGIDTDNYSIGQVILVPDMSDNKTMTNSENRYVVKKHDTFYSIARHFGLSIEQLQAANPGINILKEGEEIVIPDSCPEITSVETSPTLIEKNIPIDSITTQEEDIAEVTKPTLTIAVALPFMLDKKEDALKGKPKAKADFYRGFILAIDSLKTDDLPLTILAYDTGDSPETITQILADSRLKNAQFIIAPDNADALKLFADYGKENNIGVINVFSVKDSTYLASPSLFQTNIPYETMVERATSYIADKIDNDVTVVVLNDITAADKLPVVNSLRSKLRVRGLCIKEISYSKTLTNELLTSLATNGNYMFVPTTSNIKHDDGNLLSTLNNFKNDLTDSGSITLLGYPEWVTLRGKDLENMKNCNTLIYSRIYNNPDDPTVNTLENMHKLWYGFELPAGVPRQALVGFDMADFLLKAYSLNGGNFDSLSPSFDGSQGVFKFVKASSEGGWVNDAMYIINYRPSGLIEKIIL